MTEPIILTVTPLPGLPSSSPRMVARDDVSADLANVTGVSDFWMFLDQNSAFTNYGFANSDVPVAQLAAGIESTGRSIVCVCPMYFLPHADGLHLTAAGYARLGAYHGRPIRQTLGGSKWLPLYPTSAVRTGAQVDITFHVPVGNLAIDTSVVSNPGNYGLRWIDNGDGNSVTISSVVVQNAAAGIVRVTLSGTPTGTGQKIGIADWGTAGAPAGPTSGARACLRDSSGDTDYYGNAMPNYAAISRIDVTV